MFKYGSLIGAKLFFLGTTAPAFGCPGTVWIHRWCRARKLKTGNRAAVDKRHINTVIIITHTASGHIFFPGPERSLFRSHFFSHYTIYLFIYFNSVIILFRPPDARTPPPPTRLHFEFSTVRTICVFSLCLLRYFYADHVFAAKISQGHKYTLTHTPHTHTHTKEHTDVQIRTHTRMICTRTSVPPPPLSYWVNSATTRIIACLYVDIYISYHFPTPRHKSSGHSLNNFFFFFFLSTLPAHHHFAHRRASPYSPSRDPPCSSLPNVRVLSDRLLFMCVSYVYTHAYCICVHVHIRVYLQQIHIYVKCVQGVSGATDK